MQFVQAQFSLKYEPLRLIRRYLNEIEELLKDYYNPPQTMPIPDDFAPEAPRIIFYSKFGHSQVIFSQISVDFIINFDSDYSNDFYKTKDYIVERVKILSDILKIIQRDKYLFCGISYNCKIDTIGKKPIEYMKDYIREPIDCENLYEVSQRYALVIDNEFFVNHQMGTYKEFKSRSGIIPNLLELNESSILSEGIALNIDVNNRYGYMYNKEIQNISDIDKKISDIFNLIFEYINKWA